MFLITLIAMFDVKNGAYFGELYTKHREHVYSYLLSNVCNPHDAEDILIETFMEMWRCTERFKQASEEETKSLIIKYARNNMLDYYRRHKTRIHTISLNMENADECEEFQIPDASQDPEKILCEKESMRLLTSYIRKLPAGQREVLNMKYRMGMSNKDISEILKINIDAVNAKLYRAKLSLRKEINEGRKK